jgi:hypothetical protein
MLRGQHKLGVPTGVPTLKIRISKIGMSKSYESTNGSMLAGEELTTILFNIP